MVLKGAGFFPTSFCFVLFLANVNWVTGLEPGFEPQRVYGALEESHGITGLKKPPALPPPRPPAHERTRQTTRAGEDIVASRKST